MMGGEEAGTGMMRYTKKKIRLSQVVDKLAVLGGGALAADQRNTSPPAAAAIQTLLLYRTLHAAPPPFMAPYSEGHTSAYHAGTPLHAETAHASAYSEGALTHAAAYNNVRMAAYNDVKPMLVEEKVTQKRPKLEIETACEEQQAPLDLSVRGTRKARSRVVIEADRYPVVRGDVASCTTRESVAARYRLHVSPVVEEMPEGSDTAWACPVCGQLFSQRDRLAKHVASRHRGRSPSRSHVCWKCNRGFSRSDMLTRHLRLHTGQKPYRCAACGQIFSRSDHLATHRRTHTGEKPYRCPQCPYAACRRDMITRHMRTHRHHAPAMKAEVGTAQKNNIKSEK